MKKTKTVATITAFHALPTNNNYRSWRCKSSNYDASFYKCNRLISYYCVDTDPDPDQTFHCDDDPDLDPTPQVLLHMLENQEEIFFTFIHSSAS